MEGSVSGEAGWKGKPDQASQRKWPTSRDATQPPARRSELDMGGAAAAWFCAEIKLKSEIPDQGGLRRPASGPRPGDGQLQR